MTDRNKTKEQLLKELQETRQQLAELREVEAGRRQMEADPEKALEETRQRQKEVGALLAGACSVLRYREFIPTARSIFDTCKSLIGASAGYIALLSEDGSENEVLFLDSGGLPCSVDPSLPMPIRGLRATAYQSRKAVYHNDFSHSQWVQYMPEGHVQLQSVMFAPLVIEGKAVGLLGLANKPEGFNDNDARMASAFAELAAIALWNSRMWESLEESESRFRAVAQTASDAIITINSKGSVVLWNRGAEAIFGYQPEEVMGKPVTLVMPERFHEKHRAGLERFITTGEARIMGRTVELFGKRRDGSEFPLELSLAAWKAGEEVLITSIIRDITERRKMEEKLLSYERLAVLGKVAGSISHELRNPLAVIDSSVFYLNMLLKEGDEKVKTHLKRIHTGIQRSTRIIQSLLDLTKMQEPKLIRLELRRVTSEIIMSSEVPPAVEVI
ncbi:MAG: PAS domain S-box protein [Chloroflexota bacterium]